MSAKIIDGKQVAQTIRNQVAEQVQQRLALGKRAPGLAVILVGLDPASQVYVGSKRRACEEVGFVSRSYDLSATATQDELLAVVAKLNADPKIHGVLVQFPVPPHINQMDVVAALSPDKDVDGLTVTNAGRLASGLPALTPCTPLGCMIMLRETLGDLTGKRAVVIGRSVLVGKPVAQLLLAADCTVTIAHSRTQDLAAVCREADILVAAVGRPQMVKADWIKPGATVIDVGINRVPFRDPVKAAEGKTKLVGDVAYKEALAVAGHITPVPGGVGLMTVACLLQNTVTAAKRIAGLEA